MTITKELNSILTEPMRDYGFRLEEEDDNFVHLYLGEVETAFFSYLMGTEEIQEEVYSQIKVIDAFETTFKFIEDASEYCRDVGFKDPA